MAQKQVIIDDKTDFKSLFESGSDFLHQIDIYLASVMYKDDDLVILFDGPEGAGKSKIMRVLGAYCSMRIRSWGFKLPKFGVDNIHFDLQQYQKAAEGAAEKGVKGWINILDEGRKVANRRSAMKPETIMFTNFLSECRSSNQIHFIALPAFHDIDGNIAVWRQKFIVHVEKKYIKCQDPNYPVDVVLTRGYFAVYAKQSKIKWCYYHKVKYIYPKVADFSGRFKEILAYTDAVDVVEYDKKKDESRKEKYGMTAEGEVNLETTLAKKRQVTILNLMHFIMANLEINQVELGIIAGLDRKTVGTWIRDLGMTHDVVQQLKRIPLEYDFKSHIPPSGGKR